MSSGSLFAIYLAALTLTGACGENNIPIAPTAPDATRPVSSTPPPRSSVPIPVVSIAIGDVIRASIGTDDPICDPRGWDANSPCKVYSVTAPKDGALTVTLRISGGPTQDVLDLMLITPEGAYLYSGGGIEQRLGMQVTGGKTYQVRLNSYPYLLSPPGGSVDFELQTEM